MRSQIFNKIIINRNIDKSLVVIKRVGYNISQTQINNIIESMWMGGSIDS